MRNSFIFIQLQCNSTKWSWLCQRQQSNIQNDYTVNKVNIEQCIRKKRLYYESLDFSFMLWVILLLELNDQTKKKKFMILQIPMICFQEVIIPFNNFYTLLGNICPTVCVKYEYLKKYYGLSLFNPLIFNNRNFALANIHTSATDKNNKTFYDILFTYKSI